MTVIEDARTALREYDMSFQVHVVLDALLAEHERLTAEMHRRELHHFETEQILVQAGIDPDAAPPTDNEREALVRILVEFGYKGYPSHLAAGFRRQGPITDDMIEEARTARTLALRAGRGFEEAMRAALEAARDAS